MSDDHGASGPRVGVAMSGGGHRASVWGAGALLAVCDAGLARQVESVSSVSGGSITNGIVAAAGDMRTNPDSARSAIAGMVRTITDVGLFWFGPHTNRWVLKFLVAASITVELVLGLLLAIALASRDAWTPWLLALLAVPVAIWLVVRPKLAGSGMPVKLQVGLLGGLVVGSALGLVATWAATTAHGAARIALTWVAIVVVTALAVSWLLEVFASRSEVVDAAIAPTFLGSETGPRLAACDRGLHHVFCVTDLLSGDQLYLTPRMVTGYRVGFGTPGNLPLSTAVQCSACLPGAFPPRVLENKGDAAFGFRRSYDLDRPGFPEATVERLMVNDGGVYDNMADQWHQGFSARSRRADWPTPESVEHAVDVLVLANAGGSLNWKAAVPKRWFRDIPGLKRTIDILYDVSTSHRRQRLVERFDAAGSGAGMGGVLTHVRTSPVSVARRFGHSDDLATAARGAEMERLLLAIGNERSWFDLADRNAGVKTTLGRIAWVQVVDLAWHAYVLTRIGLWLGHGLAEPSEHDLRREVVERLLEPPSRAPVA